MSGRVECILQGDRVPVCTLTKERAGVAVGVWQVLTGEAAVGGTMGYSNYWQGGEL